MRVLRAGREPRLTGAAGCITSRGGCALPAARLIVEPQRGVAQVFSVLLVAARRWLPAVINLPGESAIGGGTAIALFSHPGAGIAVVAAATVREPGRDIPRATMLGTIATAVVYTLSLTAVFGIVPTSTMPACPRPVQEPQ